MSKLPGKRISKTLPLPDGGGIVLVDMMGLPKTTPLDDVNRNVYRLTGEGDIVWQIGTLAEGDERFPYTNIFIDDKGFLKAYCWDGGEYVADWDTGSINAGDLLK
jgi:hypothetical protein